MKRYVVGDIHGGDKALKSLLDKISFDYERDLLIVLGDIVDGWSGVKPSFDVLLTVQNLIFIKGNHDDIYLKYLNNNLTDSEEYDNWMLHGGGATLNSFTKNKTIEQAYRNLLDSSVPYYETTNGTDRYFFAHAGVPLECCQTNTTSKLSLEQVEEDYFYWDRKMVNHAFDNLKNKSFRFGDKYHKIFVGHTPVQKFEAKRTTPLIIGNVYMMDTGACYKGPLSAIDIDSNELYQSDPVYHLYPSEKGRN